MASLRQETLGGFEIHHLESDEVSLALAPRLGGRIVSLRDRRSGREWLDGWTPEENRRLHEPANTEDYATGPGAGIDECLPTVLPCEIDGRALPDHGELWRTEPDFDPASFRCRWSLRSLPLDFTRCLELRGDTLHLRYRIDNRADTPTRFQWAWHPLFTLEKNDRLAFDPAPARCLATDGSPLPWPDAAPGQDLTRAEVADAHPPCAKVFVETPGAARARLESSRGTLQLDWPGQCLPWAGIWINRGAWNGLHHWAIEPTNLAADHLSDAPVNDPLTTLPGGGRREWWIRLRLDSR